MAIHVVQQGECLSSIAARCGGTAAALHDHPNNQALKKRRPNPNVLAPGDEVFVPEARKKREAVAVEQRNRFVVTLPKIKLRLALLDSNGSPRVDKRFVLAVRSLEVRGRTAAGGLIEADIPATATSASLRVWFDDADPEPDIERELAIGCLDPVDCVVGVQARLANLGYGCATSGEIDAATIRALHVFRANNGLPAVEDPYATDAADDAPPAGDDGEEGSDADDADAADDAENDADASTFEDYLAALLDDPLRAKLQELYEGT